MPENFFATKTEVPQPVAEFDDTLGLFANDQIKSVSFLPAKPFKDNMIVALIVQYEHSILSVSVSSNNYRRLTNPDKMACEYFIRGSNDQIFYAENDLDRSSIHIIELSSKTLKVKNK